MRKLLVLLFLLVVVLGVVKPSGLGLSWSNMALAQVEATPTPSPNPEATPTPEPPRVDITQKSVEALGPLEKLLKEQTLGTVWPFNPIKYAIRASVASGVPANTIVLLL